jgi:hypothetical protein
MIICGSILLGMGKLSDKFAEKSEHTFDVQYLSSEKCTGY